VQDDIRVRKELTVSAGLRQEYQSHIGGFNLAPRGGVAWSPFKSGKTTIRGGGGIFFDWFDAQAYEQGVQLDGTHQQIETIVQPGYPNPALGGLAVTLPAGRVQFASNLAQPRLTEAIAAVEQTLPVRSGSTRCSSAAAGRISCAGSNVNAPLAERPATGPRVRHGHRDPVGREHAVRRDQREPELRAAAAPAVHGRELHVRTIDGRNRQPLRPARGQLQPSGGTRARRSASRATGS
jgi:hypothetical protein